MILGFFGCLLLASLLSGMESALGSLDRLRLRLDARRGLPGAMLLEEALTQPGFLLGMLACLGTAAKFLALLFLLNWLQVFFTLPTTVVLTLLFLPVFIFLADFVPKSICRRFPQCVLPFCQGMFWCGHWLGRLLPRMHRLFASQSPTPVQGANLPAGEAVVSVAELRRATNSAVEVGALQPLQKHFIHSILNAHEVPVRELSVPLSAIPSLPGSTRVEDVLEQSRQTGCTRWLVCHEQGGVLGQLRTFDLLLDDTHQGSAQSYVRRIPEISGEKTLLPALLTMRTLRANIALVQTPGVAPEFLSAENLVRRILLGPSQVPPSEPPEGKPD